MPPAQVPPGGYGGAPAAPPPSPPGAYPGAFGGPQPVPGAASTSAPQYGGAAAYPAPPPQAPPAQYAPNPPLEPAKAAQTTQSQSANLEFAETAPPVLGEDFLNRKIPDRGARQRRQGTGSDPGNRSSSPDVSPVLNVPVDAPRVLAALLVSYETNPLGQAWMLHQGSNLVGRAGAVAGADLELPHATVSSKHALFMVSAHPGRVVITDFGSTNGTFVNDSALVAHEPRELRDGDRIRLGLFPVIVKII
nr:hypothetical protein [uncultured bacterium]